VLKNVHQRVVLAEHFCLFWWFGSVLHSLWQELSCCSITMY